MSELTKFLEQMCSFFKEPMCPIHRFVLKHGQDFIAAKRPKGFRKRADKECFRNSTDLIMSGHNFDYVEGFAVHGGGIPLPVHHAWCVDKDGRVVDVTWRWPERSEYRGVIIPRKLLYAQLVKHKTYGMFDLGFKGANMELIERLSAGCPA